MLQSVNSLSSCLTFTGSQVLSVCSLLVFFPGFLLRSPCNASFHLGFSVCGGCRLSWTKTFMASLTLLKTFLLSVIFNPTLEGVQ